MYSFIRGGAMIYSTFFGISNTLHRFLIPRAFMDGEIQDVIDQLTIAENAEKLKAAEL